MPPGLLRTRLVPPRLPPGCLPRPGLVERVLAGLERRLVLIVAGAGYGKSTLLALALARSERPWVWCSCDARIASAAGLLAHVSAAFAQQVPGFGAGLALDGSPEDAVAEIANEVLETVPDEIVLALDDVAALGPDAAAALEPLVSDLPENVHLVLAGRSAPPLPLARLRAQGVVEIDAGALSLSPAESSALLEASGEALPDDAAAELHRRTEGWAAGLLLAARAGRPIPEGAAGGGPVFDYLAQEVWLRQPADAQAVLLDAAALERFTPDLLAAMGADRGRVDDLVAGSLFTVTLDDAGGWSRFHGLFQAFLARHAASVPAPERVDRHRRAAGAWLAAGEPAEAVPHHLGAGDPDAAVEALESLVDQMLGTPDAGTLAGWLAAIPRAHWADRPALVLAEATLLFGAARFDEAFDALEAATAAFVPVGEHERAALAIIRLLQALGAAGGGRQERGIAAARECLANLDPGARLVPAARVMLAGMYGYACRYEEAEEELAKAEASPIARLVPVLAHYATATRAFFLDRPLGRGRAALEALDRAVEALGRPGALDPLAYLPYAHAYRSVLLSEAGRYEEALAEADAVRAAAEQRGLGRAAEGAVAPLRWAALAGLGRADALEAELARGVPADHAGARGYLREAARARLAALRGQRDEALARIAAARPGIAAQGYAVEEAIHLVDLAAAARAVDAPDVALELARDALEAAGRAHAPWARARALLAVAAADDGLGGDEALATALELGERADLEPLWTVRERGLATRLLPRAVVRGLGPDGVAAGLAVAAGGEVLEAAVRAAGDAPAPARARLADGAGAASDLDPDALAGLADDPDPEVREAARRSVARLAERPRPPLRIVSLGGFRVYRADREVPESAYGRQKSRALLAVLLCARGAVHRERLLDWLWPDLAPARGLRALHTTLYELRRALEPGATRGAGGVVVAEGETYRLALGDRDEWDVARVHALAAAAAGEADPAQRIARLGAAERAFAGPFLAEWPYADWASERRQAVEETERTVLAGLAEALAQAGRASEAAVRYRRLAAAEPEREAWHRALMRVYADAGERALALRQYHACRAGLRRELGIEPGEETHRLYLTLLRAGP